MELSFQVPAVYAGAVIGEAAGVAVALAILQVVFSVFGYTVLKNDPQSPGLAAPNSDLDVQPG
ncbi:MAG: hypothetical protein LRZ99_01965 [Desulfotomaculum sp.]|nr:hypothetical protein [Desulfotomaculum sp.]MCL0081375.1 hypothetical protein [Peptococcaceae bacterium]